MNPAQHPHRLPRNLLLRLAYDGTDYSGWQIQPQRPTIQGTLAEAFARITGELVQICGSGRTDAGVHACEQAANVQLSAPIPCANLQQVLNDHLPGSIRVLSVEEVPLEFHARRDARSKTYRYRIYRGTVCPPWLCRYVYPFPYPLALEAMQAAAREFVGTRDFRSFASADDSTRDETRSTVRTLFSSVLEPTEEGLVYTVVGDGFLHHMVRNLVGTLLLLGRGGLPADSIPAILAARDRSAAGPTAPARGLHLVKVEYPSLGQSQPLARIG